MKPVFTEQELEKLKEWADYGIDNQMENFGASNRDTARGLVEVAEAIVRLSVGKQTSEDLTVLKRELLLPEGSIEEVVDVASWALLAGAVTSDQVSPDDCEMLLVYAEADEDYDGTPGWVNDLIRKLRVGAGEEDAGPEEALEKSTESSP